MITGISQGNRNITQSGSRTVIRYRIKVGARYRCTVHRCPNIIKIEGFIALMADHHIFFNALAGIGEAGLIGLAGVLRTGPSVWLNTDGDIDLRHLQGAADIPNSVILRIHGSRDHRVLRGHGRRAGVQTSYRIRGIGVPVIEIDPRQGMSFQQAIHADLVSLCGRQGQCSTVIHLAEIDRSDGDSPLIIQGEGQTVGRHGFRDQIWVGARLSPIILFTHHGLFQLPAGDGGTGQGKGLTYLQALNILGRNGIPVHIHEVDGNGGILESCVVEVENVSLRAGREDQGLLHCVREELDPGQFGMCRIKRRIIHGLCHLNYRSCVSGDTHHRFCSCYFSFLACVLIGIQDILHRIAGGITFLQILEGEHVLAVVLGKGQGLTVRLRTVAGDGDG